MDFQQRHRGHSGSSEDAGFVVMVALKLRPGHEGDREDRLEVLLSSLLRIHCVQDGLPLGGVALSQLLNLSLHHGIQGAQAQL